MKVYMILYGGRDLEEDNTLLINMSGDSAGYISKLRASEYAIFTSMEAAESKMKSFDDYFEDAHYGYFIYEVDV